MIQTLQCARCGDPLRTAERTGVCGRCLLTLAVEPSEEPADFIAGFELITVLGEGGMAIVHLAEQMFPVRREVAIKILKPGMESRHVLARFNAEQQVLAWLQHPNIAQVFDAGISRLGRSYFAMEYVDGPAITLYCQLHNLDLRARLRLFIDVCQALDHAHQKGVIHRDLKPSNILVSLQHGSPSPKIIDFGIAKALERSLLDRGLATLEGQTLGTPLYMSPEQASATAALDIRSDIYSLGVVLYELITGVTPFESLRESPTAELLRHVRDEDPAPPSDAFKPGQSLPHLQRLPSDLDWIALRALEKDPERRYASAEDFAADLERFLHDEIIEARPPSLGYRLGKTLRRHRIAVVAGVSVCLALVTGLCLSLWQAQVARRAQAKAERVASLLQRVLQSPDPFQEGRDVKVLDMLDLAERRLGDELAGDEDMFIEMALTLARTYANLTQYPQSERLLRDALQRMQSRGETSSLRFIAAHADLGEVLRWQSKHQEAIGEFQRALQTRRGNPTGYEEIHALTLQRLAETQLEIGVYTNAEALLQEAADTYRRRHGPASQQLGSVLTSLANYRELIGDEDGAIRQYREAITLLEAFPGGAQDLAVACVNLGNELRSIGRWDEAETFLRRSLPIQGRLYGPTNMHSAMTHLSLARLEVDRGHLDAAEDHAQKALRIHASILPVNHRAFVDSWGSLARIRSRQGRHPEAEQLYRSAIQLSHSTYTTNHWVTTALKVGLAPSLAAQGRLEEAESILNHAYAQFHDSLGPTDSRTQEVLRAFERIYASPQ